MTPGVELAGVSKRFRRGRETVDALRDVDLVVADGEFVAIVGTSGCGKSTLLRLVAGLLDPDGGSVKIAGGEPRAARANKTFGLVPQTPALLPWRTVRANVGLLGELNRGGASRNAMTAADTDRLIAAVGLSGFERARPAELSGGMQQRVSLARAFALGAPVLLMDEPFAALDEITREEMRLLLAQVWGRVAGQRRTVLFVTHSLEEAVLLADRVAVMSPRPGRVVAQVPVLLPHPRTAEIADSAPYRDLLRDVRVALRNHTVRPHGAAGPGGLR